MKTLHILKSEPSGMGKQIMEKISQQNEDTTRALYLGEVDWSGLVDDIFIHDKVICWW